MHLQSSTDPVRILQIELSQPLPSLTPHHPQPNQRYGRALALIRLFHRPLGILQFELGDGEIPPPSVANTIWRALHKEINQHLTAEALSPIQTLTAAGIPTTTPPNSQHLRQKLHQKPPLIDVAIATRNRTDSLAQCLQSILALDYPHFNILVVDNAPSNNDTADFIRQTYSHNPRIQYIREETPGLAVAHNRALQEATAPLIAFTDDDVSVDGQWLNALALAFDSGADVGCVSGMVFPAELETPSQIWFEQYGRFNKGFNRRRFDLNGHRPSDPLYPYTAGSLGTGANMAFRTDILRQMGGFDPALGVGSRAVGGDDLDIFFRTITNGHALVYEPAAILFHQHRRELSALRRQAYGYGIGLTAYLTSCIVNAPWRTVDLALKLPRGLHHIFSASSPKNASKDSGYPFELNAIERRGMIAGPWAYLRSRWHTRHLRLPAQK